MPKSCPVCASDDLRLLPFPSRQNTGEHAIGDCQMCSHRYLTDPPTQEEVDAFYDQRYGADQRVHRRGKPVLRDRVLIRATMPHLPRVGRVLDIGANFGSTLLAFPKGYHLEGVELSRPAAAAAARNPRLKIHRTHFEELQRDPESFDCIIAMAVIEHIMDTRSFLTKVHGLLRPGGVVVLMTGDTRSWWARHKGPEWHLYHCNGHLHFFSALSLELAFNRAGLHVFDRLWSGPNRISNRLPAVLARPLHCRVTSIAVPFLFARRQQGDHIYVWARKADG